VLRRDPDVLDGIAFGRDDLPDRLLEGDRVDVVARIVSRSFAGYESLQLEVRDVAPSGWFDVAAGATASDAAGLGTASSANPAGAVTAGGSG
jgi:hypothetical protein